MNLKRKLELATSAITSISRHDDAELAVRNAALDKLQALIETERIDAADRVQAAINAEFAEQAPESAQEG